MPSASPALIGAAPSIVAIRQMIELVADTEATVLLEGETGTGKEVIARLIHAEGPRAARPFIAANCGGLSPGLAASDLFGHEAGAFTGAVRRRSGRFEAAQGGTLFLDEVSELRPELQPLLLRTIEERAIERVGGDLMPVDVRLIAATNRPLAASVRAGEFRADLFYRLNVFPITVPPLRDRCEDIPDLVRHFLRHFAKVHRRQVESVSESVLDALSRHDWPGNVRELRNVIERAVIVSRGVELELDPAWLAAGPKSTDNAQAECGRTWAVQEKARILEALRAAGGRIYGPSGAAHRLGLRPTTLYGKMRKHGINKGDTTWE